MAKPNATGRSDHRDNFARLGHTMTSTPAYRALSPSARALIVEFATILNAKNNGELFLSVRDAADRMGVRDLKAASAALGELQSMGFIKMVADAHFAVKAGDGSRARVWQLTWEAVKGKHGATAEYLSIEPAPGTAARRRMDRGLRALKRFRQAEAKAREAKAQFAGIGFRHARPGSRSDNPNNATSEKVDSVPDSATRKMQNRGKLPKAVVLDSATHTAVPADDAEPDQSPRSTSSNPSSAGGPRLIGGTAAA